MMEKCIYSYKRKCNYYETDKMGIIYHGNYVHYLEETRVSYLESIGFPFSRLESEGVYSPVIGIDLDYKSPCHFDDLIEVNLFLVSYTGVRFEFRYVINNLTTGKEALIAHSRHCFTLSNGRVTSLKRDYKELHDIFEGIIGDNNE